MDIRWDHDSQDQWQARMAGMPRCPMRQSWAFGASMGTYGVKIGRAVIVVGGQEIALAQVLQRRGLRVIGQGPVWLKGIDAEQKLRVMRRLACHCGVTIVTPQGGLQGVGLVPLITPKASAIWQINAEPAALRMGLTGKWRNRLLNAEAEVKPTQLRGAKLQALIDVEAAQRRARRYDNLPGKMAIDWIGGVLALGWYSAGALQAGMVFVIHGQSASYFLAWASPLARDAFAHGPMLWQAALALRERGVQDVDLGDVNTESGAGLARFKLGTGAGVVYAGATSLVLPWP